MDSLPNGVRESPTTTEEGVWQRHAPARFASRALAGRRALSRWGTPDGFPLLHLGRPRSSVVVEAYRHLVDPVDDLTIVDALPPRVLVTCQVRVTDVLDLRTATARMQTGLSMDILRSDTRDRDAYRRCQQVAAVAHQLGLHGLLAPAATTLGETLAIFTDRIPPEERPTLLSEEMWLRLPIDPRGTRSAQLRVIRDPE